MLKLGRRSSGDCGGRRATGSGDVNANAVWLLSESESLKKTSRRNSCSAFTSAFKRPKGRYFRTKKLKIKPLTTENAYHFECHSLLKSLFYLHFGIFQPKMIHFSKSAMPLTLSRRREIYWRRMRRQQPVTCRRRRRCSRKFAKGRRRAISREKQRPTVPARGYGGSCSATALG